MDTSYEFLKSIKSVVKLFFFASYFWIFLQKILVPLLTFLAQPYIYTYKKYETPIFNVNSNIYYLVFKSPVFSKLLSL